jgi:hypothetical protein
MRQRAESEDAKKTGETLLLVIERLNDMQKPTWLAKVFAAYLAGEVRASDLRRLAAAIDTAFGDDLIELITSPERLPDNYVPCKMSFAASGLTEISSIGDVPANSRPGYLVSELGEVFRKAVRDHS